MELFGFEISKRLKDTTTDSGNKGSKPASIASPIPKVDYDGSLTAEATGYYGQYLDLDNTAITSDWDTIMKYRSAALTPECDTAISDIVNEAICMNDEGSPVSLNLDRLEMSDQIKDRIQEEFNNVVSLLNFSEDGADIFRSWYVDGRIFYHLLVDKNNLKNGIQELRFVDPTKIRKVREVVREKDADTGVTTERVVSEYFVYSDNAVTGGTSAMTVNYGSTVAGIKLDPNTMVYIPSGLMDINHKHVIGYLHKALKLVNQVTMMENALVIYRLARAPERRIFYIDVGNLPKGKAEEYVQGIMSKYKNKLVYNASTGEVSDDKRHMSMLEDFWLPRREGGRGTEISTLPGGENLSQIEDLLFFQRKLYKALNVPVSRMDPTTGYTVGRSTEISRDEIKFQKFVDRIRKKFSYLFLDTLRIQLILKNVIETDEWKEIKDRITVSFNKDNYFTELKNFEILKERMNILNEVSPHVGKYYSDQWVRRNILGQTQEEIDRMDKEIKGEDLDSQVSSASDNIEDHLINVEDSENRVSVEDILDSSEDSSSSKPEIV